ncbi:MAG: hypothetical protein IJN65_03040 [Clostridia bacterium]|nr:hypothetical protein [Clostridia bacterium]
MKRILSVLMALCMLLSLVSCGNNNDTSSQNKDEEYISSQTEDTKTSSDSAESTSSNNPTSKTDSAKTSTSKPKTSTDDKPSDNSSKNNTTVTTSSTPVTSKINYKQATDTDNNVTVDGDGIVSITVPKWFLLKTEPDYNYQLTDEEKNTYNFTSVTKNADGSATYKIGYNDYHKFLLLSKSSVNAIVYKYKHNTWFSEISADTGYNNIKIYTKYNSLEDFDSDFGLYIAASGLQTTFYQYMNYNCSVGTTITVYNKDNVLLATYKFPDLLK